MPPGAAVGVAVFNVTEAGNLHSITCVQADPIIEIADQILEHADPSFVERGDGIVTFHCSNGDVSYGLRGYDDLRETWIGIRAGWDPDEDDA